jgi:hypothetical protein
MCGALDTIPYLQIQHVELFFFQKMFLIQRRNIDTSRGDRKPNLLIIRNKPLKDQKPYAYKKAQPLLKHSAVPHQP